MQANEKKLLLNLYDEIITTKYVNNNQPSVVCVLGKQNRIFNSLKQNKTKQEQPVRMYARTPFVQIQ